jgi:hypothetical protein
MKFNPCGMVTDFMSTVYRTTVRPFRDSDVEVGLRYYWAPPGAKPFNHWNAITSRNWLEFHDETLQLGEVSYTDRTNYTPEPANGATGQHWCGSLHDFRDGQHYDPDAPATQYNQFGIPRCCLVVVEGSACSQSSPASTTWVGAAWIGSACSQSSPASTMWVGVAYLGSACSQSAPDARWASGTAYQGSACSQSSSRGAWSNSQWVIGRGCSISSPYSTRSWSTTWVGRGCSQSGPSADWYSVPVTTGSACSQSSPAHPPASWSYTNGAPDGYDNAYGFDTATPNWVANSFVTPTSLTTSSVALWVWVSNGDTPLTVTWGVSATAGGSDLGTATVTPTWSHQFDNGEGFDVWLATFPVVIALSAGTYWLTMLDGTTSMGQEMYWDMSTLDTTINGIAYDPFDGQVTIGGEYFTIS